MNALAKRIVAVAGLACLGLTSALGAEVWTVVGREYEVKKVVSTTDARVTVLHAGGISQFALADLSPELQSRFGYKPSKAALEERELEAKRRATAAMAQAALESRRQREIDEENRQRAAALLAQRALEQAAAQGGPEQGRPPLPEKSKFDVNEMVGKLKDKSEEEAIKLLGEPDGREEIDEGRTRLMVYRAAILDKRAGVMADFYLFLANTSFGGYKATAWGRQGIRTRIPLKD